MVAESNDLIESLHIARNTKNASLTAKSSSVSVAKLASFKRSLSLITSFKFSKRFKVSFSWFSVSSDAWISKLSSEEDDVNLGVLFLLLLFFTDSSTLWKMVPMTWVKIP